MVEVPAVVAFQEERRAVLPERGFQLPGDLLAARLLIVRDAVELAFR